MKLATTTGLSKYIVWAEALVAFFMPINIHLDTYCIILLVALWIITKGWKRLMDNSNSIKWAFFFASIFILYVLRGLFPPGIQKALPLIGEMVSLLIFPLIVIESSNLKSKVVLNALPFGCVLASLICLVHGAMQYTTLGYQAFFYVNLSALLHPGYFSMYLNFSIFILLYQLLFAQNPLPVFFKWLYIAMLALFMVMIILLSSKAGIIGFYVVALFSALFFYMDKSKPVYSLIILVGSVVVFNLCSWLILKGQPSRLSQTEHALATSSNYADSTETGELRVMVWQASFDVIKNNFFVGVGTNAETDALKEVYAKRNMAHALHTGLNAHNQFLQTFIALGVVGFLLLVIIIVAPAWYSFRTRNYIFLIFILLIALNFLTESMLQSQAGVVFYAFFNSYLFQTGKKDM